jgi:hypothetical protein
LILVSDGEDRDSFYKEPQLFELLRESDVQIYVIGFVSELTKEGGFISKSPQAKAKAFSGTAGDETGGKSYFPNDVSELDGYRQRHFQPNCERSIQSATFRPTIKKTAVSATSKFRSPTDRTNKNASPSRACRQNRNARRRADAAKYEKKK